MPKLRAIDFNKIKNGDEGEARRVIKDLLMLTPRGPNQKLRANHYFKFECHPGKEAILKTHEAYVKAEEEAEEVAEAAPEDAEESEEAAEEEEPKKVAGAEAEGLDESSFVDEAWADIDIDEV